jgi:hypothetical protein
MGESARPDARKPPQPRATQQAARAPDDLPRIITGFVLGLILALAFSVGITLLMDISLKPLAPYLGSIQECCGWAFSLLLLFLVPSLPIVGAACLARRDRTNVAQQTLSYSLSVVVLFALVCGRPVGGPLLVVIVLTGVVGLGGVLGVALVEQLWLTHNPQPPGSAGQR